MYDKLSPRGKRRFLNGIIVSAIMLFIIGFFIGKSGDNQEAEEQMVQETESMEEGFSYSDLQDNEEIDTEIKKETEEFEGEEPMHGEYKHDNPEVDYDEDAKIEVSTLKDAFSQKQINQAKEVSEKFVELYYAFDGDNPTKHIEKVKQYGTEQLLNKITGQIIRPTAEYYSRKPLEIEVFEPYEPEENTMHLKARVIGEVYNSEGEITKEEIAEYDIKLIPTEDSFKVNDYTYQTYIQGEIEG